MGLHDGRHALHFLVQLRKAVGNFLPGFGRHRNKRGSVFLRGQMPVDRVVAKIGGAPAEPTGERQPGVIKHRLERRLPVNQCRLLGPELLGLIDGSAVKRLIGLHWISV